MGKFRGGSLKKAGTNNGGILGSGIFGAFGTTVRCDVNDNSMFCLLSKLVNFIVMILFLFFVIYLIYIAFIYLSKGGLMRVGRKWRY